MKAPDIIDRRPAEMKEFYVDDWLFIGMILLKKGEMMQQHVHDYDHPTFIATGKVRIWVTDETLGIFTAPSHVTIRAGEQHKFLAHEDSTIYCIHNLRGEGYPAIREDAV